MDRWELGRTATGVTAPSWLTFEVHRPYLDGADSPLATVHSRAVPLAASRFAADLPTAPRFGMSMPAGFRTLLAQESRLRRHRLTRPDELPADLASPDWASMAAAYAGRADLDDRARVGLAHWLVAVCLPAAVLDVVPDDLPESACADPVRAALQGVRATALFAVDGLSDRTRAAYARLVEDPAPTAAHVQAVAGWGYLLSRHADSDAETPLHLARAGELLKGLVADVSAFDHTLFTARLLLREVMHAERAGEFDHAAGLLAEADGLTGALTPENDDERLLALEMRRRLIDRGVDIAVRRGDLDGERAGIAAGLALDPFDVKIRMQAAQAHERAGDDEAALAAYLHAARLGPYGTAFALLGAVGRARALGHDEFARVLAERAFRAAPRSERTRDTLIELCGDDAPMAEVVRRAGAARGHENNWHYQMYASYFNLGESGSPCLYARLPGYAQEFADAGAPPETNWQRLMPPAFRANLIRESGLHGFAVDHPADLPAELRTPAWDRLCLRVQQFADADAEAQYLTAVVLFRLGFGALVLDLVPERPVAELRTPEELRLRHWRDVVRYVGGVGTEVVEPTASFEVADHPDCPLHLRFVIAVFAVVYHARETASLEQAQAWRDRGERDLRELLASPAYSAFEKAMMESRFYRSVTYVPFLRRDREQLAREMDRAEELARAMPASTDYERFLAAENLRACLESRSKEAFGFGEHALGRARVDEVMTIDPYEPKTHMELAETLTRAGDHRAAADSYLRTARLGPIGTARGYALAAECLSRAGQDVLAEDCYLQALRIDPYAVTAARGWRATGAANGMAALATEYADTLESWGAARRAARGA